MARFDYAPIPVLDLRDRSGHVVHAASRQRVAPTRAAEPSIEPNTKKPLPSLPCCGCSVGTKGRAGLTHDGKDCRGVG